MKYYISITDGFDSIEDAIKFVQKNLSGHNTQITTKLKMEVYHDWVNGKMKDITTYINKNGKVVNRDGEEIEDGR